VQTGFIKTRRLSWQVCSPPIEVYCIPYPQYRQHMRNYWAASAPCRITIMCLDDARTNQTILKISQITRVHILRSISINQSISGNTATDATDWLITSCHFQPVDLFCDSSLWLSDHSTSRIIRVTLLFALQEILPATAQPREASNSAQIFRVSSIKCTKVAGCLSPRHALIAVCSLHATQKMRSRERLTYRRTNRKFASVWETAIEISSQCAWPRRLTLTQIAVLVYRTRRLIVPDCSRTLVDDRKSGLARVAWCAIRPIGDSSFSNPPTLACVTTPNHRVGVRSQIPISAGHYANVITLDTSRHRRGPKPCSTVLSIHQPQTAKS